MTSRFTDKVALVTGGNSGIGQAAALLFAREGAMVAVAARRTEEGEATVARIEQEGGTARFIPTDVTSQKSIEDMVARTLDAYGRLDYAFNNAGIEGTPFVETAEYETETWERVIAVNLTGVWLCMKYEIPPILERQGAIVNMASIAGLTGGRFGVGYYASKHGVIGLTRASALEYASRGIRINAICPAVIRTPLLEKHVRDNPELEQQLTAMHPMGRLGSADEVAESVAYLCSDASSFMTGHALVLDGGRLLS